MGRKKKPKMNKEKTLKIIERLTNIIKERKENEEYASAKLYVETWVIGTLNEIKVKVKNVDVPYMVKHTTYSRLFQELINFYFCRNINPSIKIYAIACLFTTETRDLIIDLYKQLFNKEQRKNDCYVTGYAEFDSKWVSKTTQFEIIRSAYIRHGAC